MKNQKIKVRLSEREIREEYSKLKSREQEAKDKLEKLKQKEETLLKR